MRAPSFWRHKGPLAQALSPLGWLYGASVAFKARHASPYRAAMPVLCIGNLTAGGSGKTPVAVAVAEALQARSKAIVFLTRGYGGKARGPAFARPHHDARLMGDEALLLARTAPTIVARDRSMGAALAADEQADALIMDDGHQNFSLAKTLSLVVVDGAAGFGNDMVLPSGPLREPVRQGLARADAVVIVGNGDPNLQGYAGPVLRAHLVPQENDFAGRAVFAFAGIGRPEKFFQTLAATGAIIKGSRSFADHHVYSPAELAALRASAKGAQLVTTEKDLVRLDPAQRDGIAALAVRVRFDDPEALDGLLRKAVP